MTARAMPIEFCKKCGVILVPLKKIKATYLVCRKCGYEKREDIRSIKITENVKKRENIIVLENDETPLPKTEMECPKCGHRKAWYWLQKTRSADEPPTQFFRCEKCRAVWREYK